MRVREWARREGFNEQTVWQWCRENRMPVPFERMSTGTIIIHDPKYESQPVAPTANGRTVCYARVSSSDQKDDLQRQADRLKAFAINMGVKSPEVVMETGSGMNDKRRKLNRLLADPTVGTLIVERRDRLARTYADISIEDLNVAGMVRNHRLARSVEDAAFAEFRRQLEYKTARTGARLHVIDRWYPSSKTCSNCGTVKAKLSLSERVYHCEECGLVIDRDLNAAINIQVAGSAPETLNARGGSGRRADASRRATRHPVKREPSGGVSRVRLGAGLGNEAMQMTSL